MNFDSIIYRPSLIDRLMLMGKKIIESRRIGSNSVIFICKKPEWVVYIKYNYPGNIQYHKIKQDDINRHIDALCSAREFIQEGKFQDVQ